jgi:hypothetical protein
MPQFITETCWGCGQTYRYDCLHIHKPPGWRTVELAGGAHMLCQVCRGLIRVEGRMSEKLIQNILRLHNIKLSETGEVLPVSGLKGS